MTVQKLDEYDGPRLGRKRAPIPDEVFDGAVYRVCRPEGYERSLESLRSLLVARAHTRGLRLRTRIEPENDAVVIQAYPREDKA